MKIFEYMGKELFASFGIPIPRGRVCRDVAAVRQTVGELGTPVVIKAQVLSGGRGKAGGIKIAADSSQAEQLSAQLLESTIQGCPVTALLVEEKLTVDQELYLAITTDPTNRCLVLIASRHGGVEIETMPESAIVRHLIDPSLGLAPFIVRDVVLRLGFLPRSDQSRALANIMQSAYRLAKEKDAELVEINPLVCSGEQFVAADAKIVIDDDALFRQKEVEYVDESTMIEQQAKSLGLAHVDLEGEIGVLANGAGITMATLDLINHYGKSAANFLDIGGGAASGVVRDALQLVFSKHPKAVLINVFGGITRCDQVAQAIVDVKRQRGFLAPVVVRLVGTNQEAGQNILQSAGIEALTNMQEAARKATELAV